MLMPQLHLKLSKFNDQAMNLVKPFQIGPAHFSFFKEPCMLDEYDRDAPLLSNSAYVCASFATSGCLQ